MYNPLNHYWFVAGDVSQVWSSSRMEYVPASDDAYQEWLLQPDNVTTTNPARADLAVVMKEQALPLLFAKGITITSSSTSSINATYGLDPVSLDRIGTAARDVAAGLGSPLGTESIEDYDLAGNVKTLSQPNILELYKAMRTYMAQVTIAVQQRAMGSGVALPSNAVSIP